MSSAPHQNLKITQLPDTPSHTGGLIREMAQPAYRAYFARRPSLPVLVAVPHSGRAYPPSLVKAMRDPARTCSRIEDRFVDKIAMQIAAQTGASFLIADAPRAMIDLNRSPEDIDWSMVRGKTGTSARRSSTNSRSRSGLGLFPRRISGLGEIWRHHFPQEELEDRFEAIHRPYHRELDGELERLRDFWGAALLLDIHSMPPLRRKAPDETPASFVLGDRFGASCDRALVDAAYETIRESGRSVVLNRPYAGGYILDRFGRPARGIHAMQLEICRSIYLDSQLNWPSPRVSTVAKLVSRIVSRLASHIAAMGQGGVFRSAAE